MTKYIVCEDKLLELFRRCPVCTRSVVVSQTIIGTLLRVKQHCAYCEYSSDWSSQPMVNNIPAGNLQLCAAVLFTGSTFCQISKVRDNNIALSYFHVTPQVIIWRCILFLLVLGCLQNPGDLWVVLQQTSGQAPYPNHKLAVEDWPGWRYWKCHC